MKKSLEVDRIIQGDCIEELKKLPDRSVDLVILDPPYWKVLAEEWDFQWRTKSDYAQWSAQWFKELSRVIKLSGSMYLFGYMRNLVYLYPEIVELGFGLRQEIIVDKGLRALGGRATKGYKLFPNVTEMIWFFNYDSKPFIKQFLKDRKKEVGISAKEINERLGVKSNGGGVWSLYTGNNILAQVPTREMWERLQEVLNFDLPYEEVGQTFNIEMGVTNVWTDINFYEEQRHHPAQKPVKLIERLINASSNPGMVVLDPFVGAGSTAIASLNLGRHYIGIDQDEKFVSICKQRISDLSGKEYLDDEVVLPSITKSQLQISLT